MDGYCIWLDLLVGWLKWLDIFCEWVCCGYGWYDVFWYCGQGDYEYEYMMGE